MRNAECGVEAANFEPEAYLIRRSFINSAFPTPHSARVYSRSMPSGRAPGTGRSRFLRDPGIAR